jgi:2-oxoacid:acceptor oxidoreductase delta subunit (pyruvate/2-ketoisovalerate family)
VHTFSNAVILAVSNAACAQASPEERRSRPLLRPQPAQLDHLPGGAARHPTQLLADVLTMRDHCPKPLEEVTLCYCRDARNNTASSLLVTGALFEGRPCLSCGNCLGCDNCYGACPDNAVIKTGPGGYEIDYDYCKGCGICAAECPSGAISMVPEEA